MDSFFRSKEPAAAVPGLFPKKAPAKTPAPASPMPISPSAALDQAVRVLSGEAGSLPKLLVPSVLRSLRMLQQTQALMPLLEERVFVLESVDPNKAARLRAGLASGRWALLFPF